MSKSLRRRIISQLSDGDRTKIDELRKQYAQTQLRDLKIILEEKKYGLRKH